MNVFSLTKKAHFSLWIQCWWVHCRPTSVGVFSVWVAADHRWSNEDIKRRRVVSSPPLPPVKQTSLSRPSSSLVSLSEICIWWNVHVPVGLLKFLSGMFFCSWKVQYVRIGPPVELRTDGGQHITPELLPLQQNHLLFYFLIKFLHIAPLISLWASRSILLCKTPY